MKFINTLLSSIFLLSCVSHGETFFEDSFDRDGLATNSRTGGAMTNVSVNGAEWVDDGEATFKSTDTFASQRALLYSQQAFSSEDGLRLTIYYKTGSIGNTGAHNFSFGLISGETNLSTYASINPFKSNTSVYSIGVNLTRDNDITAQGLNFTDGSKRVTLDQSGNRAQFLAGESTKVELEIGTGGYWCYRINDVYEASGVLLKGFDLQKKFHVAIYGRDDNGNGKSIQSVKLEKGYAPGERAASIRGGWTGGQQDLESVKDFKTLDSLGAALSDGASISARHFAPSRLMETIATQGIDGNGPAIDFVVAPSWGDLSRDEPETDEYLDRLLSYRAAGFKAEAYTNSENFVGNNADDLQPFVDRWFEYCDTNPEVQAFIDSQPYHRGVWNAANGRYEIAYNRDGSETYPLRKYMFCYAEYILKDYALRYGKYISIWIFDDGATMKDNGDSQTSGLIEEQRIFQAFSNAVHAGNPEIPVAYQNGRSNTNYASSPFAHAVRFEDFTFGHAFGGNNDHASKSGSQYDNNYRHITRMTETDGYVHDGGAWDWDDQIVGNFHSKLSTTAWKYGPNQAWEEDDFFRWNLEALQAGGHMTWDGSIRRNNPTLIPFALTLLKGLDDHLAKFQNPGAPNWARAYTPLPEANVGSAYRHVLTEGKDFFDPEGDDIDEVWFANNAPEWLTIERDDRNPGQWVISGVPEVTSFPSYSFAVFVRDVNRQRGRRVVELVVNGATGPLDDTDAGQTSNPEEDIEPTATDYPLMRSKALAKSASWDSVAAGGGAPYLEYNNDGASFRGRAISYSTASYRAAEGFRLTVNYSTELIDDSGANQFSFGLVRDTTDLADYSGDNPFRDEADVYSLGVNLTSDKGEDLQGLNFANGVAVASLDHSGTNVQFVEGGRQAEVVMEINQEGGWSYSVDGITEASGTISEGFDLSERYRVVLYAQDDTGGPKIVQSIKLESFGSTLLDGYETWIFDHSNEFGAKEEDADGDDLDNLLEYVLGGNPGVADVGIAPEIIEGVFSFDRRIDSLEDTRQQFQYSTDLATWFDVDLSDNSSRRVTIETLGNGMERVEVTINPAWEEDGKFFSRLKVE